MSGYNYLTFAVLDGDGQVRRETFYVPSSTEGERYARELARSVFEAKRQFDRAFFNPAPLVVLLPLDSLPEDVANDVDGGSIVGVPMRVVDGLDEPMLAVRLERRAMP